MTNQELQSLFSKMLKVHNNIFDIYMALEDFKADYKQSAFYNSTKKTIYEAFQFFMSTIGGVEYVINLFKNVDDREFVNILDIIAEHLSIEEVLSDLNDTDKQLFSQFLNYLPQK